MRISGFTIRQLEYFDAVASSGSLAAAASRCFVTPSAMKLAIDDLENQLGVELLVRRKGHGVSMTPVGSRLLVHMREVLSRAEELDSAASREAGALTGHLGLGCFTTLTPFVLPQVFAAFKEVYPQVQLQTVTGSAGHLSESLHQGRIDVAVLYGVDVPTGLDFEPLLQVDPHIVVSRDHPLAGRGAVHLAELRDEPFVLLDVPPTSENTHGLFKRLGISPNISYVSSDFETVRCMVGHGLGYSVMFQRPATRYTYDGQRLTALRILDDVPATDIGLARIRGTTETLRYAALRAILTASDARVPRRGAIPDSGSLGPESRIT